MTPREIVLELDKYIVGQAGPSAPSRGLAQIESAARSFRRKLPKTFCKKHSE